MQHLIYESKTNMPSLSGCSLSLAHPGKSGNGVPLLKKNSINLFINVPCPLKVTTRECLEAFVPTFNQTNKLPLYSPSLFDGQTKDIEEELKTAKSEDEIPEVLVASGLHTVFSKDFKERFIDTCIYVPAVPQSVIDKMSPYYQKLVTEKNIGVIAFGFWSIVCDLSIKIDVPYPRQWTDLVNPMYKGLLSVHGYHGKASIAALLLILKERLGDESIVNLGKNIRNIWHFAEILKRIDSDDQRRTPFNLLPNAAAVQMPSKKRGVILDFSEGPVLAPMLMYVKASKANLCQPIIDFMFGDEMRKNLHHGDFYLADEIDWSKNYCFADWDYLMKYDYEDICGMVNSKLHEGLEEDVFNLKK